MKMNATEGLSLQTCAPALRKCPIIALLAILPLLFTVACTSARLNKPTLETYGDGPGDEQGVYSWRNGPHAANSRPARPPTFSCCETQVRIRNVKTGNNQIRNVLIGAGANRRSELQAQFEVTLETQCVRQVLPAEDEDSDEEDSGGTTPRPQLADCLLTLHEVSATPAPFTTFPGGLALGAPAERTWWTSKVEKCDGRKRTVKIRVAYFARYPGAGVPRVIPAAGGGNPQLIVDFKVKPGEGVGARPHKRLTLTLNQINQQRPLTITNATRTDLAPPP